MTTQQAAPAARPKFDNHGQYSRTSILRYEMIFGPGYISTGGARTTDDLCARLGPSLRADARVLDVGSGIGGAAFHLAKTYGARVTGIDLAEEMVAVAHERARELKMENSVKFILGDVLEEKFAEPFDIIWSRDAFMHIPDYARGKTPGSPEFEKYIETTGYNVVKPEEYGRLRETAGYTDVVVDDATARFIEILKSETGRLVDKPSDFLASFSESDLKYLVDRWEMKVGFCKSGDMKWGNYLATRKG
jgi:phosphoethanolamine N-methyltransferase